MPRDERRLVLVLGPGRSGTSTMAGALAHSGFAVPDPIEAEESNPAGFFEPRWVNDFHLDLLERADVRPLDSDPDATEAVEPLLADDEARDRLRTWLAAQLDQHDRLVIKDPRLVWFRRLWVGVAEELGQAPASVIMLRHPSEVSSSRSEFYQSRAATAVAGWVNVALMAERVTRGSARALVRYPDLTADWRTTLSRVRDGPRPSARAWSRGDAAPRRRLHRRRAPSSRAGVGRHRGSRAPPRPGRRRVRGAGRDGRRRQPGAVRAARRPVR